MTITVVTSLYRCRRYLTRFFEAVERLTNPNDVELLLLHNDPTADEISVVAASIARLQQFRIKHIVIPQRESLYATWNRAIALANGAYIAIWNVDDLREPDSLERQAQSLDRHPLAAMTYGDIVGIRGLDDREGVYYRHPDFETREGQFLRRFYSSCFPMWRKSIHETIGFFDEQLKIVGDFDFQIRVARHYPLVRTAGLLGYYFEGDPNKLSSAYARHETERTMIELRYGQFDKLNLVFLVSACKQFEVRKLRWVNQEFSIEDVFRDYWWFLLPRFICLPLSLVRLPRFMWRYAKYKSTGQDHDSPLPAAGIRPGRTHPVAESKSSE